jgi:DNA invertase Pin-like site-specific DNA recombinase
MSSKIGREQLNRQAIVYVRQSTMSQVSTNLESQRRQYGLAERARTLGFQCVEIIDDDLGRSGSGIAERPGFQRLVAAVCAGQVGAVLCIEASRLARNGRDWHHLIDLCGMVGTVIIDPDGVYDARLPNDRLLLGLKGTMSEFELTLFRQRSLEAARAKAKRGELQFNLPVGLQWNELGKIELCPDRRVQEAIRMVFRKYETLGSVRQVLLWFVGEGIVFPAVTYSERRPKLVWKTPTYSTLHQLVTNPLYAGAYAYGKTEDLTQLVDGRVSKTHGHPKPIHEWSVLILDHHPGYISWKEYERNQTMLADNAHMKKKMGRKAGRGGRGLLAGLLRCSRCGRMLHVAYAGKGGSAVRYRCMGAHVTQGLAYCISFGGLRVDEAVARSILDVVSPLGIDAAVEAAKQLELEHADELEALSLELEQARYEARVAARRYEAVDPDNRLVASELEARWNAALARVDELDRRLSERTASRVERPKVDKTTLLALSESLPAVWNSPGADMRLKQRIVRTLVHEIIADVDDSSSEIVLVIHWAGGCHTEMRIRKIKVGRHGRSTSQETIDVIRRMAGRWPDDEIAATLNRLGQRTGQGNTWNQSRVYSVRRRLDLPAYNDDAQEECSTTTLNGAAQRLGVSRTVVLRLIDEKLLAATQATKCAPWEIAVSALDDKRVQQAARAARRSGRGTRRFAANRHVLRLPGIESEE